MFIHSNWHGEDIYVSPKGKVYCLYIFGGNKCLIMDDDLTLEQLKIIDEVGDVEFLDMQKEIPVTWIYADDYLKEGFKQAVIKLVEHYERDSDEFFKYINSR